MNNSVIGLAALLLVSTVGTALAQRGPCGNRFVPQNSTGRLEAVGLTTDGRLICFIAAAPNFTKQIGTVTGLTGSDTFLIGIDYRVQDGQLYGVGNGGGIYTINPANAAALLVAQLSVALNGMAFGVDFNPVANALRIVSNSGQNLRYAFAGGVTNVDMPLSSMGVAGAAYSNNDLHPNTATTLFDIDALADLVTIQAPPNNGTLNTTGILGVDTGAQVGFDIYSTLSAGKTVSNVAYAVLNVNGVAGSYLINVLTGGAALLGNFSAQNQVTDLAIPLNQF